jgi:glycosyltransferase involved in cell wall biosynthesis
VRKKRLWITWEWQRRSIELAQAFGCRLAVLDFAGRPWRYVRSLAATTALLARWRPRVLFVQNPSMVLAAFACAAGVLLRIPVVVDRHSSFRLDEDLRATFRGRVFLALHLFTLRRADLTIVTNSFLAGLVGAAGGRAAVLPDRFPTLRSTARVSVEGTISILFPASYNRDEPIDAVLDACRELPGTIHVYITGNYRRHDPSLPDRAPANVTFTGFLSEEEYVNLITSVDAVLALTTAEACMLCGCYEAIAAGKALITSDQEVLRDYFSKAVFVDNTPGSIERGIREFIDNSDRCTSDSRAMLAELSGRWDGSFQAVSSTIEQLG